jgi:amidophosphoribosyltransferase
MEFKDRNVLLVDDSIVRGTTSREIVTMAREAGAKKVHFASCAPPITHAHIYGIDLASPTELVAHNRDSKLIADHIGADTVIYQSLEDLKQACIDAAHETGSTGAPQNFEVGVFCGSYITPVGAGYFEHLERLRGEGRKHKMMAQARQAVAQGTAEEVQVQMAAKGVVVNGAGQVVPATNGASDALRPPLNGSRTDNRYSSASHEDGEPTDTQDISLHNLNDYQ